jgi:hypothetical protein
MIVNISTKAVEVEHAQPDVSTTDPKTIHPQIRRVRVTDQGTYLVSLLKMDRVVEYDKKFREIWSYPIKSPWAAIRLKNGNTLITDEDDVLTREVNSKKETVWELTKKDIPPQYWYGNAQSATRLANGRADAIFALNWGCTMLTLRGLRQLRKTPGSVLSH